MGTLQEGIHTHIHAYIHAYVYIHIQTARSQRWAHYKNACCTVNTHTHTYIHTYINIHTAHSPRWAHWKKACRTVAHTYIHTYTHTYTYTYIHIQTARSQHWVHYKNTCCTVNTHTYTYIHTYINIHTAHSPRWAHQKKACRTVIHTHMHMHIYIHKYTHSSQVTLGTLEEGMQDSRTFIHTYIHTYIHTHIHTYIYRRLATNAGHTRRGHPVQSATHTCIHTHTYIHIKTAPTMGTSQKGRSVQSYTHTYIHTHTDGSQPTLGTLEEGIQYSQPRRAWLHYSIVHTKQGSETAYLYRDGVLVKSADIPYQWDGQTLTCQIGNHASTQAYANYSGDIVQFYYWNASLTQPELSYTRATGTPQHKSSSVNVYSVTSSACQDVNECVLGTHTCAATTTCRNTYGSYVCMDVSLIDVTDAVTDVNECASKRCANYTNHTCYNTIGSFTCTCSTGTTHTLTFNDTQSETFTPSKNTRLGPDGITLSLWVRASDATNRYQPLLECVDGDDTQRVYFALMFNAYTSVVQYAVDDVYVQHSDATGEYASSSWVHVAVVHDPRGIYMYRNGVNVLFSTFKYVFLSSDKATCGVGKSLSGDVGYFVGRMRAVYVWARPLSVAEVCLMCVHTQCLVVCVCVCLMRAVYVWRGL